jgi:hypothetical protein
VTEYDIRFTKGDKIPENMATLDHLNQKSERKPRPAWGSTVLACWDCNNRRGAAANANSHERLPCQECGRSSQKGRFCSGECFKANLERLGRTVLPWEEHRLEMLRARKREKARRQRRNRRRREAERKKQAQAAFVTA